jgi:malate synthase
MEDSATAEIARAQIWQWLRHRATLEDGRVVDESRVQSIEEEELDSIRESLGAELYERGRFKEAQALFERVALEESFPEFLTLPGLEYID